MGETFFRRGDRAVTRFGLCHLVVDARLDEDFHERVRTLAGDGLLREGPASSLRSFVEALDGEWRGAPRALLHRFR